jgi:hypothetical protein
MTPRGILHQLCQKKVLEDKAVFYKRSMNAIESSLEGLQKVQNLAQYLQKITSDSISAASNMSSVMDSNATGSLFELKQGRMQLRSFVLANLEAMVSEIPGAVLAECIQPSIIKTFINAIIDGRESSARLENFRFHPLEDLIPFYKFIASNMNVNNKKSQRRSLIRQTNEAIITLSTVVVERMKTVNYTLKVNALVLKILHKGILKHDVYTVIYVVTLGSSIYSLA